MTDTDTVVFWDDEGCEIVTISATGIDSSLLVDIFDTTENRNAIEKASGRMVDNTSEECHAEWV